MSYRGVVFSTLFSVFGNEVKNALVLDILRSKLYKLSSKSLFRFRIFDISQ